jgi:pimeloyl-ACP methyl ester carboxylesterase
VESEKEMYIKTGEKIAYRKLGQGQKVVLLNAHDKPSQFYASLMSELAKEYEVLMIDLRGCGKSSYLRTFDTFAELASDLVEVIYHLEYQESYLLGWLYAGAVALELAGLLPEIKGCMLLSSIGVQGYTTFVELQGEKIALQQRVKKQVQIHKLKQQLLKEYHQQENLWQEMIQNSPQTQQHESLPSKAHVIENYQEALFQFNITTENNGLVAGSNHLSNIHCPLLIVHHHQDQMQDVQVWDHHAVQGRKEQTTICLLENSPKQSGILITVLQQFIQCHPSIHAQ